MGKHIYEVIINGRTRNQYIQYDFGNIKGICLSVGDQKAIIRIEVGSLRKVVDILCFRYKDFRDAYRKTFLIHALKYNKGLEVKRINVSIDGEEQHFDREHDPTGHFPYMFSMIEKRELYLHDSWKSLIQQVVTTTKTNVDKDLRFSAMYSFLASKSRIYSVDRFSNLWTSMNAYFSFVSERYEESLISVYNIENLKGKLKVKGRDAESIGLLSWMIGEECTDISNRDRLAELWKDNYVIEDTLKDYTTDDIAKLYDAAEVRLKGVALPEKYVVLERRAREFGISLYVFLLLSYPYNLRCKYFHGNSTTMLIAAYNDYEITALETVNFFMTEFLNIGIPRMFQDDFWTNKEQEKAIAYVEHITGKSIEKLIENARKNNKG